MSNLPVHTISHARLIAGVLFLGLLAGGCATPQSRALLSSKPETLAVSALLTNVPFFAQEKYQCGPAALAMTLSWAGFDVTPEQLKPRVYLPKRRGSLQVEMLATARSHGALAYRIDARLADLLAEIDAGHPVIVFQNLGLTGIPVWHYAVVIGYDLEEKTIVLHSGTERGRKMPLTTFERTWARADYWALLTLPPGRMPRTATEGRYITAVLTLEKNGKWRHAVAAYKAALSRWPRSLPARMGLGNSYYAMEMLPEAEQAFRQAIRDHADAAPAYNNLAQTLADQGQYAEALSMAKKAVSLGGRFVAAYRRTLASILRRMK